MARYAALWITSLACATFWSAPQAPAADKAVKAAYEEEDSSENEPLTPQPIEAANDQQDQSSGSFELQEDSSNDDSDKAFEPAEAGINAPQAGENSTDNGTPKDNSEDTNDNSGSDDADSSDDDSSSGDDSSENPTQKPDEQKNSSSDELIQPQANAGEPELIQERYPNSAIKIEREVTQDANGNYVNHGSWKMWDQRGNVIAEGQYLDGERDGTWNRWYRAGEAELLGKMPYQQYQGPYISQATFQYGKLDGKWTLYDSKQRKMSEFSFTGGKRHGKSTWWYGSGQVMREVTYRDGEIDGQYVEFSEDAKPIIRETYQGGRRLATKVGYHSNQQKKSEGTYLFAKDVEVTPDDWAECKLATYEKQGKDEKHGPWISWYPTGQKQMEGAYRNDAQVGKFTWWHPNGQKALEGSYDVGKQHGKWVWWHPNGQKAIQGEYVRGNPTGHWSWWNEDGKVAQAADMSHAEGLVVEMPKPDVIKPQPAQQRSATRPRRAVR